MPGMIPATEKASGRDRTPPPQIEENRLKIATVREDFR